jgi:hypothetical protein
MSSITLHEWVLTILNQSIRADAEFQINQRSAWQEFSKSQGLVNGIDLTAGFQQQRNLLMNELIFELDLVPDLPGFWDKISSLLFFRKVAGGCFYRLRKKGEQHPEGIHVKLIITRDTDNRYKPEVFLDPKNSKKPEEIHVFGIAR